MTTEFVARFFDTGSGSYDGPLNKVGLRDYDRVVAVGVFADTLCAAAAVAWKCGKKNKKDPTFQKFGTRSEADKALADCKGEKIFFSNFQSTEFPNSTFLVPFGENIETPHTIVCPETWSFTRTIYIFLEMNMPLVHWAVVQESEHSSSRSDETFMVMCGVNRVAESPFTELKPIVFKGFMSTFNMLVLGITDYFSRCFWFWAGNNVKIVVSPVSISRPASSILKVPETKGDTQITVVYLERYVLDNEMLFRIFGKRDIGVFQKLRSEHLSVSEEEGSAFLHVNVDGFKPKHLANLLVGKNTRISRFRTFDPFLRMDATKCLNMGRLHVGQIQHLAKNYPSCLEFALELKGLPKVLKKEFGIESMSSAETVKSIADFVLPKKKPVPAETS